MTVEQLLKTVDFEDQTFAMDWNNGYYFLLPHQEKNVTDIRIFFNYPRTSKFKQKVYGNQDFLDNDGSLGNRPKYSTYTKQELSQGGTGKVTGIRIKYNVPSPKIHKKLIKQFGQPTSGAEGNKGVLGGASYAHQWVKTANGRRYTISAYYKYEYPFILIELAD